MIPCGIPVSAFSEMSIVSCSLRSFGVVTSELVTEGDGLFSPQVSAASLLALVVSLASVLARLFCFRVGYWFS